MSHAILLPTLGQHITPPAGFDPLTLSPIRLWDPDGLGLAADDPVSTLTDTSGNAGHYTASGGARPLYKPGLVNGRAALLFDGANDALVATTPGGIAAMTVFAVVKVNSEAAGNSLWGMESASAQASLYPYSDGVIYDGTFTTVRKTVGDPGPVLTSWHVYEIHSAAGHWEAKLDGASLFNTATNTVASPAAMALGTNKDGSVWLAGHVAYKAMFDRDTDTTDSDLMRNFLGDRFGIAVV